MCTPAGRFCREHPSWSLDMTHLPPKTSAHTPSSCCHCNSGPVLAAMHEMLEEAMVAAIASISGNDAVYAGDQNYSEEDPVSPAAWPATEPQLPLDAEPSRANGWPWVPAGIVWWEMLRRAAVQFGVLLLVLGIMWLRGALPSPLQERLEAAKRILGLVQLEGDNSE